MTWRLIVLMHELHFKISFLKRWPSCPGLNVIRKWINTFNSDGVCECCWRRSEFEGYLRCVLYLIDGYLFQIMLLAVETCIFLMNHTFPCQEIKRYFITLFCQYKGEIPWLIIYVNMGLCICLLLAESRYLNDKNPCKTILSHASQTNAYLKLRLSHKMHTHESKVLIKKLFYPSFPNSWIAQSLSTSNH